MNDLTVPFLLLVLAVYRVARLLVFEDGPYKVLLRLRVAAGVYDRTEQGEVIAPLGNLLSCPHCVGMWLSLPAALMLLFVPFILTGIGLLWVLVVLLALAGAQSLLQSLVER